MIENKHQHFMLQALIESRKARSLSSPNPNVGALLVKNNRIISRGHTQIPGKDHAEIAALKKAPYNLKGVSLYVTMEPCSHYGKTPPCTDMIIKRGVKKVIIGIKDPHKLVHGKGVLQLRQNNISVITDVLKDKINQELQWYLKYTIKKTPYVTLKSGISLDGCTTDYQQSSRWITSVNARMLSQTLRLENDGIIAGIKTIMKDNPFLTYRGKKRKQLFYRIVLDTNFSIQKNATVLKNSEGHKTIIAISRQCPNMLKIQEFKKRNIDIILCKTRNDLIDLKDLLIQLGNRGIAKLIVEGGSTVNYSFLKYDLADKLQLSIAPILLGGVESKGLIQGKGFPLQMHKKVQNGKFYNHLSDNFIFEGYLHHYVYRNH
ncbi:MAG: bifunctional diaminohydroxyphosphoribosylaminopyrimidine deaminase/5-amino-6-(5-phosphoribosylamino)uracil reductase RibD [Spirochaetes bacterium]|nr:bifunctional diaminohydroxyphosphoribosylaminopyrimidine deaminase/5-amino-6-(5-phosphoribosylamino)uracil reductase RibD [Spirochaetota bacterium]